MSNNQRDSNSNKSLASIIGSVALGAAAVLGAGYVLYNELRDDGQHSVLNDTHVPHSQRAGPTEVRLSEECAICRMELVPREEFERAETPVPVSVAACSHYFHASCLEEWLKIKKTCPMCRSPIKIDYNILV